ncbi:MAG TPA: hypothetical protein VF331_02860 [Polyangiales bacterium]
MTDGPMPPERAVLGRNAIRVGLVVAATVAAASSFAFAGGREPAGTAFPIPQGEAGIGFDDLRYSSTLQRVLVPSGRAGALSLIEPQTGQLSAVRGFSTDAQYAGGHNFGVTSVDEGRGLLFVSDRTSKQAYAIDPKTLRIVCSVKLAAQPDYVRFVATRSELWVTEPDAEQIEIFSVSQDAVPGLTHAGTIHVANGPESLVIDEADGRAYTHRWQTFSLAIDLASRRIVGQWPNACEASRGIAFDAQTGFLLAVCSEGTVSVLDTRHDGRVINKRRSGSGYDVVGWNPRLRHLYLAGRACACLTIVSVSLQGKLKVLGSLSAPVSTHCVTADEHDNAWVCDPSKGRLLRVHDPYPASR